MINKLFGLEDPLVQKINEKYGDGIGKWWNWSNISIKIYLISFFIMLIISFSMFILFYIEFILFYTEDLFSYITIPICLIGLVMSFSSLAYIVSTTYITYRTKDYLWTIGIIIGFIIGIFLGFLPGPIVLIYKYIKGKELKKL